jgi:hypothetical protein
VLSLATDVRLPDALWEIFDGWAVAYEGDLVSIRTGCGGLATVRE